MTLADQIKSDASSVFISADEFAEPVTYRPRAGGTRSIDAVVIREGLEGFGEDEDQTVIPVFEVHVINDSTSGISSTELDLGGDAIDLPVRPGETASTRSITQLLVQDEGMLVLQCQ